MTTATWHQADIATNPQTEWAVMATHVAPALDRATRLGAVNSWWYIRKHVWRVRIHTDETGNTMIGDLLDTLATDGHIPGWHPGIYEPETAAFGGPDGMDCAHRLFPADSHCRRILTLNTVCQAARAVRCPSLVWTVVDLRVRCPAADRLGVSAYRSTCTARYD